MKGVNMKNFNYLIAFSILIFSSSLNAQWIRTNGPTGGVYSLAASDTCLFAGNNNGKIFCSTNNGTTWTTVYSGTAGTRTDALAISDTNLFAANDVGILRSTNNGTSWTMVGLTGGLGPQALAISDTNIFAGTFQSGVYRSTNNGTNWTEVNSGLTDTARFITALFAVDTNLFAGTWGRSAFRSTDKGESWIPANIGLTSTHVHAFTVYTNPVSGTNLFAGTFFSDGVYLSTDNGGNWIAMNNGLTNSNVRSLAVFDTNLFAGTHLGGVFRSANNGISWTTFSEGLTNSDINALLVYDSTLFAGTENGVWRRSLSDITGVEDQNYEITSQFTLEQNYPNPFNPTTTIRYFIPNSEFVTLKVYDVLGNEVATLVNEEKPAGSYKVNFNAAKLSSGIYFYSLQAGSFTQTKKLILIK
jgi:photosystem II stability/assembly factor-like uncharacterized protein